MWMGLLPAKWKASALLALHFYNLSAAESYTHVVRKCIYLETRRKADWSFLSLTEAAAWTIPMKGAQMTPWKYLHQLKYLILSTAWQVKEEIPHFSLLNFLIKYLSLHCSHDCIFWTANVSLKPSTVCLSLSLRLCFPCCEHFSGFLAFRFTWSLFQLGKTEELCHCALLNNWHSLAC